VIAPIVQDEPGNAPDNVSATVAELQRIAHISGSSHPIGQLRIMFVVGSPWPWRAIEYDRASRASPRRRMMCFRESEQIQRMLLERLDWQRADEQFVSQHMATPGNLPGITSDWVPSHSFDDVFESYRLTSREQRYQTAPDRVVNFGRTA
jgi:hypothetical protein